MTLPEFIEKFGRTVFESPLATASKSDEPPELAEIRLALLDHAREKSYRAGGRKVFPYDLLRVHLRGVEESRYSTFSGRFFRQYLEQELRTGLRDAGCRYPEHLRVEVLPVVGLPQRGEEWLIVETASQEKSPTAPARLVVRTGEANVTELSLEKARTNIGRVVDVYRNAGPSRRNDLAFAAENEINATVSREHAHIQFDRATGEYRLFNDRWYPRGSECGLWIIRDGISHEVHRDTRGARLQNADEVHLGKAVVIFER
jgi:hypothetical protein